MDMLTLKAAQKYAKKLVDNVPGAGDVTELQEKAERLDEEAAEIIADMAIVDTDGDIAAKLILNRLRQHIWENEEAALICEEGAVTLNNSAKWPFNNSKATIALANRQRDTGYAIAAEIGTASGGSAGDIGISDKATNGFKMEFTGGAKTVTVKYIVIGGIM